MYFWKKLLWDARDTQSNLSRLHASYYNVDACLCAISQLCHYILTCKGVLDMQGSRILLLFFFVLCSPISTIKTCYQLLLVQDGKLYGRYPMFSMITRVVGLPEVTENHDIQKNEFMVQLGQVMQL